MVEDTIRGSITRTAQASYLSLDPEIRQLIFANLHRVVRNALSAGVRPILLCQPDVRRFVRVMLSDDLPDLAVLSYQELPGHLVIHPLGRVTLEGELAAA